MVGQTVSFGRRGIPPRRPNTGKAPDDTRAKVDKPAGAMAAELPRPAPATPPPDDGLRDWKRERRRNYALPWRQISLMASLCFGIGSLALPSSVNGAVQWLLYGLAAASLVAGLRRRA